MNTQRCIPVTDTGHPLSYETNRQVASQARSEFLAEGFAYIYQSIRTALGKSLRTMANGTQRPFEKA